MQVKIILKITLLFVCYTLCISTIQQGIKRDLDSMVQNTFGNQMLDDIQRMVKAGKSQNQLLDNLDKLMENSRQESIKDKETFNKDSNECMKNVSTTKQDLQNTKSLKENLEQKPEQYQQELQFIQKIINQRQQIMDEKQSILNQLQANRDFIFKKYLGIYDSFGDSQTFFKQMLQKLKELQNATQNDDQGSIQDINDDIKKLMEQNQKINHPYVSLALALEKLFEDINDIDVVKKIQKIINNLNDDIEGTQENFQSLETQRTSNFKYEVERLELEVKTGTNTIVQLKDYSSYLQNKIQNIQQTIIDLGKQQEVNDEEVMTKKAHCEGEQSRFSQRDREREQEQQVLKKLVEYLDSNFQEVSDYIKNMDLKLFIISNYY